MINSSRLFHMISRLRRLLPLGSVAKVHDCLKAASIVVHTEDFAESGPNYFVGHSSKEMTVFLRQTRYWRHIMVSTVIEAPSRECHEQPDYGS